MKAKPQTTAAAWREVEDRALALFWTIARQPIELLDWILRAIFRGRPG